MTGREGETFPGFFYGRSRAAGCGRTGGPLVAGRRRWPGSAVIGSSPPSMGLEEASGREARRRFCGAVLGDVRKDREVDALRGAHSGIACSGTFFGGGSMLLEKNANIFLCLFGMLIE